MDIVAIRDKFREVLAQRERALQMAEGVITSHGWMVVWPQYWLAFGGERIVPVEFGACYTREDAQRIALVLTLDAAGGEAAVAMPRVQALREAADDTRAAMLDFEAWASTQS